LKYLSDIYIEENKESLLPQQVKKILKWHEDKNHTPSDGSYSPAPI